MRKFLALGLLMALLIGTASAALFESGTKDAQPTVLYGKYNNTIVPIKVAADGTVGAGGVAGSDTQVQFNDGGAMAGDAGLTYNKTTDDLSLVGSLLIDSKFELFSQDYISAGQDSLSYRSLATNNETRIQIMPNGTPATPQGNDTLWAGIKIFGTNFFADESNNDDFGIYVTPTSNQFNAKFNGTGTLKPFVFSDMDTDYLMKLTTNNSSTAGGSLYLYKPHIFFVSTGDSISSLISVLSAGDTIVLGSGTYTITADLAVNKAINIIGQGPGATTISTSTADINVFNITASNARISDLSISSTANATTQSRAIYINGSGGSVLSGVRINNVSITMSGSGIQQGIRLLDASAEITNVIGSITSSNNSAQGIQGTNAATAEAITTINIYQCNMTVSSGGTEGNGFYATDSSAANNITMNVYNSKAIVSEGAATTSRGAAASAAKAFLNIYNCTLGATDNDIVNSSATVANYGSILVNNTSSGTITGTGVIQTGGYKSSDGTLGVTVTTCTGFKNGLCISGT